MDLDLDVIPHEHSDQEHHTDEVEFASEEEDAAPVEPPKKPKGRPKGSLDKPRAANAPARGRPKKKKQATELQQQPESDDFGAMELDENAFAELDAVEQAHGTISPLYKYTG